MNNKTIAVIAVAAVFVLAAAAYGGYYAYATMVLMPEDKKIFEEELESINSFNESKQISDEQIDLIENYDALSLIPQSEREATADNITSGINSTNEEFEDLKANVTRNQEIASRYDLIFKGDVADDIRSVYNQEIIDLADRILKNIDKQAEDIKKGDSKAYADDLREFNDLYEEYVEWSKVAKEKLQNIVTNMGG